MCVHRFIFPEDKPENYNRDGRTLMGRCKCGATHKAYGLRYAINREETFLYQDPFGDSQTVFLDKLIEVW